MIATSLLTLGKLKVDLAPVAGEITPLPGNSWLERYADRHETLSQKHTLNHPFCPYGQTANLAVRRLGNYSAPLNSAALNLPGSFTRTSWNHARIDKGYRVITLGLHQKSFRKI